MQKDFDSESVKKAMDFANSPTGQQLLSQLQQTDSEALQEAIKQATNGNFAKLKQTLSPLLGSEEIVKLLNQMGG